MGHVVMFMLCLDRVRWPSGAGECRVVSGRRRSGTDVGGARSVGWGRVGSVEE